MQLAVEFASNVTIARRLVVLLTVPLVALLGLGVFTRLQLAEIEERSRLVAESRIVALATLGNLSRGFSELRVNVRSYLLAENDTQRPSMRTSGMSPACFRSTATASSSATRSAGFSTSTRRSAATGSATPSRRWRCSTQGRVGKRLDS
jgi:hypothetical protein